MSRSIMYGNAINTVNAGPIDVKRTIGMQAHSSSVRALCLKHAMVTREIQMSQRSMPVPM